MASGAKRSAIAVALVLEACCFGGASVPPPPPPPPGASAPPTTAEPEAPADPGPVMLPVAPGTPEPPPVSDPAALAQARDVAVCSAALHCCEAASREARMAARMEGIDPREGPRRDPYYDPRTDPRRDPRLRAPRRLAARCRELRSGQGATADACTEQIESMRHAFRELRAPIPSSCRVPDLPQQP